MARAHGQILFGDDWPLARVPLTFGRRKSCASGNYSSPSTGTSPEVAPRSAGGLYVLERVAGDEDQPRTARWLRELEPEGLVVAQAPDR